MNNKCSEANRTKLPADLKINEAIDPITPGRAAADFLANSFNHSANFLSPSFTLSEIEGSGFGSGGSGFGVGGSGVGAGGSGPGVGLGLPFRELLIAKPIVESVAITAVTIAVIVKPSALKSNLILSFKGILESG